ncbi:MAG: MBL fold metallo-hydrolase [Lachnospiraceae bacterium]|jgi:L-ascorbate metabolism protein UlaG (beta-lactamase superfamily)|nr:MBL fold metallo-hydrolase [Lachnospiraceae bacterium]
MRITYLGHSGFLAETKEHYLLFDYYTGKLPVFSPEKKLTVFVSHSHQDHYNKEIFALQNGLHITYVLSGDIRRKRIEELVHRENELLSVKAHETYRLYGDQMAIETLRSTDIGVAYLVTLSEEGRTYHFYHAGDLNLWKWAEESKAHNNNMEANFRREMELIRGRHFDAAFVPLDPRQEDFAFGGMDLFLETADADAVFPMHFWKQPEIIRAYLKARPQVKNLILLEEEGRTCEF